jgi:lipoate-protein ligase A
MNKIESKGHKSVRSRVANISEFLKKELSVSEFRQRLLDGLYRERDNFETYHLTDDEWNAVHALKDEKYGNWDWNFGRSPDFNIQRSKRFPVGEIDLRLDVEKGHIKNLKIYGDFFGKEPVDEIEEILKDVRYDPSDIEIALNGIDVKEYFGNVEKAEFLELVYGEDE